MNRRRQIVTIIGKGMALLLVAWIVRGCYKTWRANTIESISEQGAVLARAIYRFKATHGLWPLEVREFLEELPGGRPPAETISGLGDPTEVMSRYRGWLYEWGGGEGFALHKLKRHFVKRSLRVSFAVRQTGGEVEFSRASPIPAPSVPVRSSTDPERSQAALELLDSRIRAYPNHSVHVRGKIGLLVRSGQYLEAMAACRQIMTHEKYKRMLYPKLMQLDIGCRSGSFEDSEREMLDYLTSSEEFEDVRQAIEHTDYEAAFARLKEHASQEMTMYGPWRLGLFSDERALVCAYALSVALWQYSERELAACDGIITEAISYLENEAEGLDYYEVVTSEWRKEEVPSALWLLRALVAARRSDPASSRQFLRKVLSGREDTSDESKGPIHELYAAFSLESALEVLTPAFVINSFDTYGTYE